MEVDTSTHSPLGGSGAHRFIKCPGSIQNSRGIGHDEDPESDFATLGVAAHSLGEVCLNKKTDPWQYIGKLADGAGVYNRGAPKGAVEIDKEMADAVQVYLDALEDWHPSDTRDQGNTFIEKRFHCPTLHKFFWGTSDFVYVDFTNRTLHVWDYKHGAGIVVEVQKNPQCMYYACGILEELDLWGDIDRVVLHVAQPRGWHYDGPIRHWTITTLKLEAWLDDVLLPAMDIALVSRDTTSGSHCRFCPARVRACPQLIEDMDELAELAVMANKHGVAKLTNVQIGRFKDLFELCKIVNKAADQTAFVRMEVGQEIPGYKIGKKRANREWKEGAERAIRKKFGKKAMTESVLKSPAQIEALPEGETMTARWAFKPDTGLTVVPADDARPAANKSVKELFKANQAKGK